MSELARLVDLGFPIFRFPIERCNALNSSPYTTDYSEFRRVFSGSDSRSMLLTRLEGALTEARELGASVIAMMVGGSFIRVSTSRPKDIDGLMFYVTGPEVNVAGLVELQRRCISGGIDVRFVPAEANPVMLIRVVSFFTSLYTTVRSPGSPKQGVLIVSGLPGAVDRE